ncbi:MAG: PfkB family carbohydrate kinase [Burkholderiales bacterium]
MNSEMDALAGAIRRIASTRSKVVFVSGNFNIVHPGHVRLLNFAASCGDVLVVGVLPDNSEGATLPEALRLEGVKSINAVTFGFVLRETPEAFITRLKPDVVVKGKEREFQDNPEAKVVESYGGKLIFSSGDTRFSLVELLRKELQDGRHSTIERPLDYIGRHALSFSELGRIVRNLASLKVVVIGDLIVDEYINCEPLGMSQEDPTIVVTPIKSDKFVGGAGIVAAHARGLGAQVTYLTVTGRDDTAKFALDKLREFNVDVQHVEDDSRPTTLKQRFRAQNKTLLRVSHLREHGIGAGLCDDLFNRMQPALRGADLVVFSDFSYGCLPQPLVDRIVSACTERRIMMVADSQSSSQVGDVSRFAGMCLLTPTEREARLALRDFNSGLVVLAQALQDKCNAGDVLVKLGSEGVLVQPKQGSEQALTDRIPALNTSPKDVSGAGDSMLIATSMAMAAQADIWQSAYLGSLAAACQVGRMGNVPLTAAELSMELQA